MVPITWGIIIHFLKAKEWGYMVVVKFCFFVMTTGVGEAVYRDLDEVGSALGKNWCSFEIRCGFFVLVLLSTYPDRCNWVELSSGAGAKFV